MRAIKAGILSASSEAELKNLKAERRRLESLEGGRGETYEQIAPFLPNSEARYCQLLMIFKSLPQRYVAEAREEVKALVGGAIQLMPTAEGHLEAHVLDHYGGLVTLAVGLELKKGGCGGRI